MADHTRPMPALRAWPVSKRARRPDRLAGKRVVVWLPLPPPPTIAQAGTTVAVWAAATALVAVALIAVVALLLGAVELGVALHDATHQPSTIVGRTY